MVEISSFSWRKISASWTLICCSFSICCTFTCSVTTCCCAEQTYRTSTCICLSDQLHLLRLCNYYKAHLYYSKPIKVCTNNRFLFAHFLGFLHLFLCLFPDLMYLPPRDTLLLWSVVGL